MKPIVMRLCIIFGVMLTVSHSVQASIVMNYGDYTAATIDFDPNGFATSSAGAIPDITDGNLTFDIYAQAGSFIEAVQFSEAGGFTLLGLGTDNTFVDLYEVDEIGIDTVSSTASMTFNANINIDDSGAVTISSNSSEEIAKAEKWVLGIVTEAEVGKIYDGVVIKLMEYGAFVEILPGKDGLVHISELADCRIDKVEDVCKVGDQMWVKCIGVDDRGRIKLSRRAAMADRDAEAETDADA